MPKVLDFGVKQLNDSVKMLSPRGLKCEMFEQDFELFVYYPAKHRTIYVRKMDNCNFDSDDLFFMLKERGYRFMEKPTWLFSWHDDGGGKGCYKIKAMTKTEAINKGFQKAKKSPKCKGDIGYGWECHLILNGVLWR